MLYAELYYYSTLENTTTLVVRVAATDMTAETVLAVLDSQHLILPPKDSNEYNDIVAEFRQTEKLTIRKTTGTYFLNMCHTNYELPVVNELVIDPVQLVPISKSHRNPNQFIVLEGMDGCGKSTQVKLLTARLHECGNEVVACNDPGSTVLSEELRTLVKYREDIQVAPLAEALLFSAARAQLVEEVIAPALQKGHTVVCDRFELSTYVYQGLGAKVSDNLIKELGSIFQQVYPIIPQLTFVLDLPVHEALSRLPEKRDKIEQRGINYFSNVRDRYTKMVKRFHRHTSEFYVIDAHGTPEQVHERIWKLIPDTLKKKGVKK